MAEALNEIRGVERTLVLASAAVSDEPILDDELAERSAEASFTRLAIAEAHSDYVPTGDLTGIGDQRTHRRSD